MMEDSSDDVGAASAEELQRLAGVGWHRPRDLFEKSETQLVGALGCSVGRVNELRASAARRMVRSATALELLESSGERHVATGFDALDLALGGGVRRGTVTELVGLAGAGKTQCCLQLAASCARRREAVIYLDTERSFNAKRLVQLGRARGWMSEDELECVLVWRPQSSDELLSSLEAGGVVERKAVDHRAGLLVLDSVAMLVRTDFSRDELRERQAWLATAAGSLKRIARLANLAVVATNHVMADLSSPDEDSNKIAPTLGFLWHHCVTTRLLLEPREGHSPTNDDNGDDCRRGRRQGRITVAKSPAMPETTVEYALDTKGLVFPGIVGTSTMSSGSHQSLS